MEDLYTILKVDPTSSQQQIKENYQKLLLRYHPDKNQSSDTTAFVKLRNAYKILGDDALRKEYDEMWEFRCSRQHLPIDRDVHFTDFNVDDDDENSYYYRCRCGGEFVLTETESKLRFDIICCDICSLTIRVLYQTEEEEESSACDELSAGTGSLKQKCDINTVPS